MTAEAVRIALEGVCLGAYAKKPYNSGNSMYSRDSTQDSTENFTDGSESHPYIHKSPTTPPKPATGLSDSEGDEDPHPWLGVHLLRIVEMTLHVRTLTPGEIDAVWELAERQERKPSTVTRPWQVALFALCSLKHAVLGPAGLPALIATLDSMLAPQVPAGAVIWEDVALTLRALAFLSEHAWVAESVGGEFVVSLLGVFRRPIPARWLCIRFWAMDTTRNITAHCPSLVRTLVREDAARAFATLAAAPVPAPSSPSSPSSSSLPSTPTRSRISVNSTMSMNSGQGARPGSSSSQRPADPETAPTRDRLLEGYKREAARRAEELAAYIKNWTEWESFGAGTGPGALEPVSIVGTF
ncbi:hypothetical protein K439DRAFT_410421 [Ramaria rubella]|nr:hypothetical protein K439DRAFT_410421 [Ramaria rubella]